MNSADVPSIRFLCYTHGMTDNPKPDRRTDGVPSDPIVAVATALAPAALGIVRASGGGALALASRVFSRPQKLLQAASHTLVYGWILDPDTGSKIDEVVAAVYRAPAGFTGEDAVEIICHGGPAVVTAVYRAFLRAGFRQAEGGEFSLRAFANGKTDLTRAEAIGEIIAAKTAEARKKASARLSGSLSAAFSAIRAKVLEAAAAVAVEIEYPEDEETVKGAFRPSLIRSAAEDLRALSATWAAEKLYQNGAELVLAGATNAGKSRLFNLLLKEERAIVSEIHGTTRDWIEAEADFGGIPVRLFDTAGLRETSNRIEAEGISRTRGLLERADIIFYVVDSAQGLTGEDRAFLCGESGKRTPVFLVWNKTDREDSLPAERIPPEWIPQTGTVFRGVFPVSAKTGDGLAYLVKCAGETLLANTESVSAETALGSLRQKKAAENAEACLRTALQNAEAGFPLDTVIQDLEDALFALGEITGETVTADVLEEVFSKFCVGK